MSVSDLPRGRARLAAVIRAAGDVVRIDDAEQALDVPRDRAAKLLSRWADQGWLRRVGTGAYVPVELELLDSEQVVQDPWILVPALFAPAYIGGRTAAEHWDLTEQLFRDIVVFTARPVRQKTVEQQSAVFTLKHIREEVIFGTKTAWRGQTRVAVSDIHRTIVDMLDDPAVGGGIQHVEDCFSQYMKRSDRDPAKLVEYAERHGNGAIFKRLGFLAERHPAGQVLVDAARARLTKGHTKLDSALACDRLVTRWRLRVPASWLKGSAHDR
jgi:predicted transcriptional regulator of viral defense system